MCAKVRNKTDISKFMLQRYNIFLAVYEYLDKGKKCGHLVKVIWSKSISGTRSLLTIYKYKYLYYSGGF